VHAHFVGRSQKRNHDRVKGVIPKRSSFDSRQGGPAVDTRTPLEYLEPARRGAVDQGGLIPVLSPVQAPVKSFCWVASDAFTFHSLEPLDAYRLSVVSPTRRRTISTDGVSCT
jgi:hypothetical protein